MLELHIWGPALGLPSLDAECLAAIHYLRSTLKNDSWRLVPSSNPSLNPFRRLPALRDNSVWVAGYDEIQQYLSEQDDGVLHLDGGLDDTQRADCDAYTSFLYSRGLPLLDLSLYVSSDNYTACTRAALGELLPWPQSWTIPHQLRDRAKKRSEHLGLHALDVDAAHEEDPNPTSLTAKIPASLRKPKQTVSGLLGRSVPKTRFRLDAVTEDFLEPLHTQLAGRDWLVADKISSADCLAIAIISLMQAPSLPQAWLREALVGKYSSLSRWAEIHATETYGNAVSMASVMNGNIMDSSLPWTTPPLQSWKQASILAIEAVVSSVPVLRSGYECHQVPEQTRFTRGAIDYRLQKSQIYADLHDRQRLYSQIVAACVGTVSVLGWMAHIGLIAMPRLQTLKHSRRNFGEAGAILGL